MADSGTGVGTQRCAQAVVNWGDHHKTVVYCSLLMWDYNNEVNV